MEEGFIYCIPVEIARAHVSTKEKKWRKSRGYRRIDPRSIERNDEGSGEGDVCWFPCDHHGLVRRKGRRIGDHDKLY